jgi:hypothetical protein
MKYNVCFYRVWGYKCLPILGTVKGFHCFPFLLILALSQDTLKSQHATPRNRWQIFLLCPESRGHEYVIQASSLRWLYPKTRHSVGPFITIKQYPFLCHANGCFYFFFCYDCWLIPALGADLATTCEDTSLTTRIHRFRAPLNTGDVHSSHSATWSTLQIRNCICLGPYIRTIDYAIVNP